MPDYSDLDPVFQPTLSRCQPATMTSVERIYALYKAVEYLSIAQVPGDFVECGVWRGGSMMCAALTLLQVGDTHRQLYLYDTFEGMVPPDNTDVDVNGQQQQRSSRQSSALRTATYGATQRSKRCAEIWHRPAIPRTKSTMCGVQWNRRSPVRSLRRSPCSAWIRTGTPQPSTSCGTAFSP